MNASEVEINAAYDEETIPQDESQGPGWFLKLSYVVIVAFCLYYLFTYWNWKSDYETDLETSRGGASSMVTKE